MRSRIAILVVKLSAWIAVAAPSQHSLFASPPDQQECHSTVLVSHSVSPTEEIFRHGTILFIATAVALLLLIGIGLVVLCRFRSWIKTAKSVQTPDIMQAWGIVLRTVGMLAIAVAAVFGLWRYWDTRTLELAQQNEELAQKTSGVQL